MSDKRKHTARVVYAPNARRKDGMAGFARNWNPASFGGELRPDRSCQFVDCEVRSVRGNYCAEHAVVMYADKQSTDAKTRPVPVGLLLDSNACHSPVCDE